MCAKKYSPQPKRAQPAPAAAPQSAVIPEQPIATNAGAAAAAVPAEPSWIDSADPRRRTIAKVVLAVVWIYVAALWLLALDQWFNWGVFGTKIPPLP
jgi:hypothetical protein